MSPHPAHGMAARRACGQSPPLKPSISHPSRGVYPAFQVRQKAAGARAAVRRPLLPAARCLLDYRKCTESFADAPEPSRHRRRHRRRSAAAAAAAACTTRDLRGPSPCAAAQLKRVICISTACRAILVVNLWSSSGAQQPWPQRQRRASRGPLWLPHFWAWPCAPKCCWPCTACSAGGCRCDQPSLIPWPPVRQPLVE